MPSYRLDFLASLARQMAFVPAIVREKQLQAAETLLLSVDAARAYPPAYVTFRITGYRPDAAPIDLATGLALQHDLGLLIEQVSDTLGDHAAARSEPVLQIDDLVARFNVTSKTIQRWRRRGLAARRFIFPDGKRRVGFRLAVVDQFFAAHGQSLQACVNVKSIDTAEWSIIVRRARRLAADPRRPVSEIAERVGRSVGRSALAIEAELRKHDAEHPAHAVLTGRPATAPDAAGNAVRRLAECGLPIERIAAELDLPRSTAYRLLLADRLQRITTKRIKFLDDPLYHQPDAEAVLNHLLSQEPITESSSTPPLEQGVPSELRAICEHSVLTAAQERALFLQYNFRKFQAVQARRKLDPMRIGRRQITRVERLLGRATDVRNHIVRANLRLVVSVAKKHVRPNLPLADLVSEGSLTLMRAVESFDTRKGNKFSTYATLALMKGYARTAGRASARSAAVLTDVADRTADCRQDGVARVDMNDRIDHLLAGLDVDEQSAVRQQFGLQMSACASLDSKSLRHLCQSGLKKLSAAPWV